MTHREREWRQATIQLRERERIQREKDVREAVGIWECNSVQSNKCQDHLLALDVWLAENMHKTSGLKPLVDLQPAHMEDRRGEPRTWVDYNHYMRPANKLTLFLGSDYVHQHYKPDADDTLDHHDQMEKLWCIALNVDMDDRHLLENIKLDATDFFAVQAINVAGRGYYRSKDRIYTCCAKSLKVRLIRKRIPKRTRSTCVRPQRQPGTWAGNSLRKP